jgi:hypothetical protein
VGNIKLNLREIGWCGTDWIDLAQAWNQWRACEDSTKPLSSIKHLGSFWAAAHVLYVSSKKPDLRLIFNGLHGFLSQKTNVQI